MTQTKMTIGNKNMGPRGRVWVRSSALLPIILPISPPPNITMVSLAKLRGKMQESLEEWDIGKSRWAELTKEVLGLPKQLADIYFETCVLGFNTGSKNKTSPFHLLLTTLFLQLARESIDDHIRVTEEEAVGKWVCANVKHLLHLLKTLKPAQEQNLRSNLFSFTKSNGCPLAAYVQKEAKVEDDLEGTLATIRRGKRLAWQLEGGGGHKAVLERLKDLHPVDRQGIAGGFQEILTEISHAKLAISSIESGVPTVVVSQLCRQGLARKGGAVMGAKLVLHRGLAVTAACGRLVVRDCHDLSISLLTPLNPLVCSSSTQISFAPLCSAYSGMHGDLEAAGLKLDEPGKWHLPVVLGEESKQNNTKSCSTITADRFHMVDLPLEGVGRSDGELAKLSKEFQDEVGRKRSKEELWESLVSALHPVQKKALQDRVNQKFSAFLATKQSIHNVQH